ncbi:hypothetical protein ACRS6Y_08510 [Bacillus cytotoxicus]|uniref:Uncharacterized protein n=1 Tax=Bacillus cytotoxicus TaxID=580165 RepID=A0AAX2CGZ2_9BACI|nr:MULTISPECIES: hypothetical protein [Bacillus cereus group]AWC28791.1 hypothetical protein CG483_010730 [Bacillus cytotoxicus]AWC32798.1 hypothetical protein CG482_010455 [Bacillus cytotoxicus]AWC36825.1 hypothetical protein CG481_010470 [Bacillus cytotoxicus]AWC39826.1 hypothetical protein CG480_004525 [Bacillus cytotoxicus]AWC47757.1 hypothetical protein CG478_004525 [Bacillus cytotoxicus]
MKKSKAERKRDLEIVNLYHKKLTEEELEKLSVKFIEWKEGKLPYCELTEHIHECHKKNQIIWTRFHNMNDEFLIFQAKKELNLFSERDMEKEQYKRWNTF